MRHDLDAARATAAQAKLDYERAKQNFAGEDPRRGGLTRRPSRASTPPRRPSPRPSSACDSTAADLTASRDSLSKTTVTAPIDGIVTALPIKEGEVTVIGTMNNAGTQLMTISDMATVEAVMMVDETAVPQVKLGQKAMLSIDAYPDRKFEGMVTEVGTSPIPKNDPDLQALTPNSEAINFKVKIRLDKPPDTIRPGFSVTADIVTGRARRRHGDPAPGARRPRRRTTKGKTPTTGSRPRPRRASTSSRTASSSSRRSRRASPAS